MAIPKICSGPTTVELASEKGVGKMGNRTVTEHMRTQDWLFAILTLVAITALTVFIAREIHACIQRGKIPLIDRH